MMLAKWGEYELSTYDSGYVIERVAVKGEVNKITGEPVKDPGAITRQEPRYYGRIDHAVLRMAGLCADVSGAVEHLDHWLAEYRRAGLAIAAEIGKAMRK
jgi:hypothetical protein